MTTLTMTELKSFCYEFFNCYSTEDMKQNCLNFPFNTLNFSLKESWLKIYKSIQDNTIYDSFGENESEILENVTNVPTFSDLPQYELKGEPKLDLMQEIYKLDDIALNRNCIVQPDLLKDTLTVINCETKKTWTYPLEHDSIFKINTGLVIGLYTQKCGLTKGLTLQQENVIENINSPDNLAVNAVAGSGKTYTALQAIEKSDPSLKVTFCAFNKTIAEELKKKLKDNHNVCVSTIHGLGCSLLSSRYKIKEVYPNKHTDTVKKLKANHQYFLIDVLNDTYNFYCHNLLSYDELYLAKSYAFNKFNLSYEVCPHFDTYLVNHIKQCFKLFTDNEIITFSEMLYLPWKLNLKDKQSNTEVCIVDECQDLNLGQIEIIKRANPYAKFVTIGDPNQAIYGFMGADCNSFNNLVNELNSEILPLSYNFRCPHTVIGEIKDLQPERLNHLEAHPNNIIGEVIKISYSEFDYKKFNASDCILARTNSQLYLLAIKLFKLKIPFNLTSDFSLGDLMPNTEKDYNNLNEKIKELKEKPNTNEYLLDKIEICELLLSETKTLEDFKRLFKELSKNKDGLTLSSIHKAKGKEWNVVYILNQKLPLVWKNQTDEQYKQELNLQYVAFTRAKKKLILLT